MIDNGTNPPRSWIVWPYCTSVAFVVKVALPLMKSKGMQVLLDEMCFTGINLRHSIATQVLKFFPIVHVLE